MLASSRSRAAQRARRDAPAARRASQPPRSPPRAAAAAGATTAGRPTPSAARCSRRRAARSTRTPTTRSRPSPATTPRRRPRRSGIPVTLGGHVEPARARAPPGAPSGRTTASGRPRGLVPRLDRERPDDPAPDRRGRRPTNDLDLELRAARRDARRRAARRRAAPRRSRSATTGDYYVVVVAASGFSNYTLTIGQTTGERRPGARARVRARARSWCATATIAAGRAASGVARARSVGMRHVSGEPDGPMLFAAETLAERRAGVRGARPRAHAGDARRGESRGERSLRDDTRQIAAALRRRARGPQRRSQLRAHAPPRFPPTSSIPFQWHYDQINLPAGLGRRPRRTAAWSSRCSTRA